MRNMVICVVGAVVLLVGGMAIGRGQRPTPVHAESQPLAVVAAPEPTGIPADYSRAAEAAKEDPASRFAGTSWQFRGSFGYIVRVVFNRNGTMQYHTNRYQWNVASPTVMTVVTDQRKLRFEWSFNDDGSAQVKSVDQKTGELTETFQATQL